MKLNILTILTAVLLLLGAGDPKSGKDKVAVCAGCHGADGNSLVGIWPSLAGQNQNYLLKQLRLVKTGKREIASMIGILDNLDDSDLQDIAAFYESKVNTIGTVAEDKVEILEGQNSHVLVSFAEANAMVYLADDKDAINIGDIVETHLLPT